MIATILVINKFNWYNKEIFAEAICNSAQSLIRKYMDCRIHRLAPVSNVNFLVKKIAIYKLYLEVEVLGLDIRDW